MLGQLFLAGTLSEGDLLRLVDGRRFAVVQLLLPEIGAPVERAGLNRCPAFCRAGTPGIHADLADQGTVI